MNLAAHGEELATELVATRCERGSNIALQLGFNQNVAGGIRHLDENWNGKGKPYHLVGKDIPINSRRFSALRGRSRVLMENLG